MRELVIDAKNWIEPDDVYDLFFRAVGAPQWHGRNLNALRESITQGGINAVQVPYLIRVKNYSALGDGARLAARDFIDLIRELHESGCPVNVIVEDVSPPERSPK